MPCTEYSIYRSFTKFIRKIDLISMSGYLNDASGLEAVSGVMQLVYYRNKNQHRLAKWWKWLSMLRRCVQKLLAAFQAHDRDRAVCRVDYIQQILLPRCYTCFSQVVADTQFAALGLTLLGIIARLKNILGGVKGAGKASDIEIEGAAHVGGGASVEGEDFGSNVPRVSDELSLDIAINDGSKSLHVLRHVSLPLEPDKPSASSSVRVRVSPGDGRAANERPASPAGKRRGKKRNAIDDLFSGL